MFCLLHVSISIPVLKEGAQVMVLCAGVRCVHVFVSACVQGKCGSGCWPFMAQALLSAVVLGMLLSAVILCTLLSTVIFFRALLSMVVFLCALLSAVVLICVLLSMDIFDGLAAVVRHMEVVAFVGPVRKGGVLFSFLSSLSFPLPSSLSLPSLSLPLAMHVVHVCVHCVS